MNPPVLILQPQFWVLGTRMQEDDRESILLLQQGVVLDTVEDRIIISDTYMCIDKSTYSASQCKLISCLE